MFFIEYTTTISFMAYFVPAWQIRKINVSHHSTHSNVKFMVKINLGIYLIQLLKTKKQFYLILK